MKGAQLKREDNQPEDANLLFATDGPVSARFSSIRLLGAFVISGGTAFAGPVTDTLELAPLVYTAGRSPTRFKDSPVGVTVVGERQMRNNGAQRLGDVL